MVGAGLRQREFAPRPGVVVNPQKEGVALGIRRSHHIAVYVAAGGDGVQQHLVHSLNERLHISLQNAMKLECLPCRETERRGGKFLGEFVQNEPLLGSRPAARQAHAKHKAESLLLAGFLQRRALIPIVLQIETVKFGELAVALGNRSCGPIGQILCDGAAQKIRAGFDAFVGTRRFDGFGSELISSLAD